MLSARSLKICLAAETSENRCLRILKASLCSHRNPVPFLSHTPTWSLPPRTLSFPNHNPQLSINYISVSNFQRILPFISSSFMSLSRPSANPIQASILHPFLTFSTFSSLLYFFIRHNFLFPFLPPSHPLLSFLPSLQAIVGSLPAEPFINTSSLPSSLPCFPFAKTTNVYPEHLIASPCVLLSRRSFLLSSPCFSFPGDYPVILRLLYPK